jgi:hypothetical protein
MGFKFNPFTRRLDITDSGGGGGTGILSITGNSGGAVSADLSNNINLIGSGSVSVAGNPGTNTLTVMVSSPTFAWSVKTLDFTAVTLNGYFTNGGLRINVQLPATSAVGDTFAVSDYGGNGWEIVQATGQQIRFGTSSTTSGATGSLQSIHAGDSVFVVCVVANTIWQVVNSVGNITVV